MTVFKSSFRSTPSIGSSFLGVLLLLVTTGCSDQNEAAIAEPALDETCIICEGDDGGTYINPWVDSVFEASGQRHNNGLIEVYASLDSATDAVGRPLTYDEAMAVAKARTTAYLESRGMPTVTDRGWDSVMQAIERYEAGEDIVAIYGASLSPEARNLAYQILATEATSADVVEEDMQAVKRRADRELFGSEREYFIGNSGIGEHSGYYWESNIARWEGTLAASSSGCRDEIILGDIIGGLFGLTRMPPTVLSVVGSALAGSVGASIICVMLD